MENIVSAPHVKMGKCNKARHSSTEKTSQGRMSVDEYITLVRKALDKRYADLQS